MGMAGIGDDKLKCSLQAVHTERSAWMKCVDEHGGSPGQVWALHIWTLVDLQLHCGCVFGLGQSV